MGRYRKTKNFTDVLGNPFALPKPKRTKTAPQLQVDLSPYHYDEPHVYQTILAEIERGQTDRALLAVEVCEKLFSGYVVFPPGPSDTPSAQSVWALVVDAVQDVCSRFNVSERSWQPTQTVQWQIAQITDPGYPWETPSLDVHNAAVPSMFIEVGVDRAPSDYDTLIRDFLTHALILSGSNPALATGTSTTSKRLRREARKLFNDMQFHDQLYGQTNIGYAGGQEWMLNDQGRGLNWKPYHANNLERLSEGLPAKRTTTEGGRPLPAPHSGRDAMLLWMPAIDPGGLRGPDLTVRPLRWSDGSSTQEPPPVVQQLGVDLSGVHV